MFEPVSGEGPYWSTLAACPSFPVITGGDENACFWKFVIFGCQVSNFSDYFLSLLFYPFIILPLFPPLSRSFSLLTVPPVSFLKLHTSLQTRCVRQSKTTEDFIPSTSNTISSCFRRPWDFPSPLSVSPNCRSLLTPSPQCL